MKVGDWVVCRNSSGYAFTEGRKYLVLEYDKPAQWGEHFTAPAYVTVADDMGELRMAHANRFHPPYKPRVVWSPFMQAWTWPWGGSMPSKEYIAFIAELNRRNMT